MTGQGKIPGPGTAVEAKQKLKEINQQWVAALVRRDTALLNHLMAEDCIFSYALDGDDRAQFISDIDSGDLQVAFLERDTLEVRIYGSTGVVIAYDTADWRYKGRRIQGNYRTMHVYAERDGLWQIVAIQASPISSK
jgi:ketosteroid isomerase-like protein